MQYGVGDRPKRTIQNQVPTTILSSDVERRKRPPPSGELTKSEYREENGRKGIGGLAQGDSNRRWKRSKRSRKQGPTIVWFQGHDLRVADHLALSMALRRGGSIIPVFIWNPDLWSPGEAGRWWLKKSLLSLESDLLALNLKLVIRIDSTTAYETLWQLVKQVEADAVYWHRQYNIATIDREEKLRQTLASTGIDARSLKSELLVEPWELETRFTVLHNYMTAWMNFPPPPMPSPAPAPVPLVKGGNKAVPSLSIDELGLDLPKVREEQYDRVWQPGSKSAIKKLSEFLKGSFKTFGEGRSRRDIYGTSKLSPHLQFGEISPRQVYHFVRSQMTKLGLKTSDKEVEGYARASRAFLKNLCSREFAHHLLYHNPSAANYSLIPHYENFPWSNDNEAWISWTEARTGYPLVDAALRDLKATGWIHNILRYLLASFLTKYLLLPWQHGANRFFNLLVDGDMKSNIVGWQWSFGSNSDSLPVNSLINPVGLARKQDPTGYYVRKWLPELSKLPNKYLHCPWKAPVSVLREAGVGLGVNYPAPIVDASFARQRARNALVVMRGILSGQQPNRWSLILNSEIDSERRSDDPENMSRRENDKQFSRLWQLRSGDQTAIAEQTHPSKPLFVSPTAGVSILNRAEVRNDFSGLTPTQSTAPFRVNGSAYPSSSPTHVATSEDDGNSPKDAGCHESMDLAERNDVMTRMILDENHEFHSFAVYIQKTYELTDNTDRRTSKDYVRLCTLRDQFPRATSQSDERQKITIYKMKTFFGKVLRMEVTGEWDRHNHGGVRGPYVYGLRLRRHRSPNLDTKA
uniref:Photolyase/cryptochrome alpha/beta domain-containing protein n=1 Tax=Rhodosorus marinus TaxID=101924 RepID=A0A7S0BSU6_9RHOD|mmetsp:Transcript_5976/g.8458  ORF Transcript_5976/g.8458 Transcript_5976/m.8458 type:complete len:806 (+) Transcript_5976:242-2659(+)